VLANAGPVNTARVSTTTFPSGDDGGSDLQKTAARTAPLDHHDRRVVLQLALLVVEDGVKEATRIVSGAGVAAVDVRVIMSTRRSTPKNFPSAERPSMSPWVKNSTWRARRYTTPLATLSEAPLRIGADIVRPRPFLTPAAARLGD
jgi:hypothetical protein